MPPGRYLTFGATPPVEGLNEYGEVQGQIVLMTRDEHPAMRYVNLDPVYIARAALLQPADDVETLAAGTGGPVILSIARGPMQVIHVAFDPAQSNWPLHRSWVTFIFNAVEYLGQVGEGFTSKGFTVGGALTARLPASAMNVQLHSPDSMTLPLNPSDPTMLSWGPIRLSGLYMLTWNTQGEEEPKRRAFAVNILSEAEGRISIVEGLTIGRETVAGSSSSASAYTPLWPYAVLFCLAVLMLEWWVYHRKTFI